MAARVEALKDDFLTCPLCLHVFVEPKILPCQHTFCLKCFENYLFSNRFPNGRCSCPVCRKHATVPEGDAKKLDNNFLILGLLQFVQDSENAQGEDSDIPAQPPSDDCPSCREMRPFAGYCFQCKFWLCTTCHRSHGNFPATKEHNVCSVQDLHAKIQQKMQKLEELVGGLLSETSARQVQVFLEQQELANQSSDTVFSLHTTISHLKSVLEDMHHQLLTQLYHEVEGADQHLIKVAGELDCRKILLEKVKDRIKEVRNSTDLGCGIKLVQDLQKELRHLAPLPAGHSGTKLQGVSFDSAPHLLTSLQADAVGHLGIFHNVTTKENQLFDPEMEFTLVSGVSLELCLLTGLAVVGSSGEGVIFVKGNKMVCSNVPQAGWAMRGLDAPDFAFSQAEIFKRPWGVAVTFDKKVLVTDAGTRPGEGFIAVCDMSGRLTGFLAKGLSLPRGIAMGPGNLVYVCDQDDRCVYVLDYCKNGSVVKVLKKDVAGKYHFLAPMAVTVAAYGDIIVSDAGKFIKIFSSDFTLKTTYKSPFPKSEFWGVCADAGGQVYVADWNYGVQVLSYTPCVTFEGLLKGVKSANIVEPTAVVVSQDSETVFVGTSDSKIYKGSVLLHS